MNGWNGTSVTPEVTNTKTKHFMGIVDCLRRIRGQTHTPSKLQNTKMKNIIF